MSHKLVVDLLLFYSLLTLVILKLLLATTIRVETGSDQAAYLQQMGHFFSGLCRLLDQTNKTSIFILKLSSV